MVFGLKTDALRNSMGERERERRGPNAKKCRKTILLFYVSLRLYFYKYLKSNFHYRWATQKQRRRRFFLSNRKRTNIELKSTLWPLETGNESDSLSVVVTKIVLFFVYLLWWSNLEIWNNLKYFTESHNELGFNKFFQKSALFLS